VEKAAVSLAMGIACWTLVPHAAGLEMSEALEEMSKAVSDTGQIVFFLIGGMAIVETVDAHKGFSFITDRITTTDKRALVLLARTSSQKSTLNGGFTLKIY
jgi:Na+/H+ antiporter NhaD/arsenite permease-like protein